MSSTGSCLKPLWSTISIVSAPAVEFSRVSKSYSIYAAPGDRLKELATFNQRSFHTDYWALRDVSFEVQRGETFCIVGENGSGKSTLLQICAGILQPTAGTAIGQRPRRGAARTRLRLQSRILRPRQRLSERRDPRLFHQGDGSPVRRHRSLRRDRRLHQPAGQDLFERHGGPAGLRRRDSRRSGDPAGGRGARGRRRLLPPALHAQGSRAAGARNYDSIRISRDRRCEGAWAIAPCGWNTAMSWPSERRISLSCKYLAAMAEKDARYLAHDTELHHAAASYQPPPENRRGHPQHRSSLRRRPGGDPRHRSLTTADGNTIHSLQPDSTIVVRISVRAKANLDRPIVGFMFRNHLGVDFAGTNTAREGYALPPMAQAKSARWISTSICPRSIRLRFRSRRPSPTERSNITPCATGSTTPWCCRWNQSDGPIYGQFHFPCRVEVNSRIGAGVAGAVSEFTGERVIPGQVNDDLWAEHISRYAFAARFAAGKRVLDIGCGTGYGTAELAQHAAIGRWHRHRRRRDRLRARALSVRTYALLKHPPTALPFREQLLRPGHRVRGHRTSDRLARLCWPKPAACSHPNGSFPRLDAQQALLRGIPRQRRARIRSTRTNSNSRNSETRSPSSFRTSRSCCKTGWNRVRSSIRPQAAFSTRGSNR